MNEAFSGRHSMGSADWCTPAPLIEAAREVMGGIDLDPASDFEANKVVQATGYYTEADDGLMQEWRGRVFLNPPGGLVSEFWAKLVTCCEARSVPQAIWIGYSLEQLQTLQRTCPVTPLDFTLCVPKRRIAFVENEAKRALRLEKIRAENEKRRVAGRKLMSEKNGPSHGNYITYIGPEFGKFASVFGKFGQCVVR